MVRRWGEVDERVGFQRLLVLETIAVMDQGLACNQSWVFTSSLNQRLTWDGELTVRIVGRNWSRLAAAALRLTQSFKGWPGADEVVLGADGGGLGADERGHAGTHVLWRPRLGVVHIRLGDLGCKGWFLLDPNPIIVYPCNWQANPGTPV